MNRAKKAFHAAPAAFAVMFAATLLAACPLVDLALNNPVVSASRGTHADKIAVSWSGPTFDSDSELEVSHYVVEWSGYGSGASGEVTGTSYDITAVAKGRKYDIHVTAYLRNKGTKEAAGTRKSLAYAEGFAMDASRLSFLASGTRLALSGDTEYWFETMLQKGFTYRFFPSDANVSLEIMPSGSLDPVKAFIPMGYPETEWKCDSTGASGKFYVKITTPAGTYAIDCSYGTR